MLVFSGMRVDQREGYFIYSLRLSDWGKKMVNIHGGSENNVVNNSTC